MLRPSAPLLVLLLGAALACSDPAGPPISRESLYLYVQNDLTQYYPSGLTDFAVTAEVVLVDGVDRADQIRSLLVRFPDDGPVVTVPPEFETRLSGAVAASVTVPVTWPPRGDFILEARLENGDMVAAFHTFSVSALPAPTILEVTRSEAAVLVRWSTPVQAHDWELQLVRLEGEDETVVDAVRGSSDGEATFTASIDLPGDDAEYGMVLVMTSSGNHRRMVITIPEPPAPTP